MTSQKSCQGPKCWYRKQERVFQQRWSTAIRALKTNPRHLTLVTTRRGAWFILTVNLGTDAFELGLSQDWTNRDCRVTTHSLSHPVEHETLVQSTRRDCFWSISESFMNTMLVRLETTFTPSATSTYPTKELSCTDEWAEVSYDYPTLRRPGTNPSIDAWMTIGPSSL